MVVRENAILVGGGNQGLPDYEQTAEPRISNILNAYHFKDEVKRETAPM